MSAKGTDEYRQEQRAREARRYATDPVCRETMRDRSKAWRLANPGQHFANMLHRYDLTVVQYLAIIHVQGNRCAICGTTKPTPNTDQRWNVDHDHTTGKVRGVLCLCCNSGIGKLGDSVVALQRATDYLRSAQ